MKKKSINRQVVQRAIMDGRASGKTDQEIYYELSQEGYDKKAIALLITGTVTAEDKAKYKTYNHVLLALIGLTIVLMVIPEISPAKNGEVVHLFFFIIPLVYIFFGIAQYHAPAYRASGILILIGFLLMSSLTMVIETVYGSPHAVELFFYIVLAGFISGLSFYLDRKLFPNYRPTKLKKDSNGEYTL